MTYGPGFAEALAVIACTCWAVFRLARLDKNAVGEPKWKQVHKRMLVLGILLCSVSVCVLCGDNSCAGEGRSYFVRVLLLSIVSACLLAACVMDVETHLVYDYVWWISGSAAVLLLLLSGNNPMVWRDILCFILLQQLLFGKMYGRADCHAFSVCALAEGAFAMSMQDYLMHMLIAFCILAVLQLAGGNVGRDGKLRAPIPFLPYIAGAFWGLLLAKFFVHIYAFHIAFSLAK